MKLIVNIAWTHVSSRVRQTLVGMAGVSMGVGFTIMMAGLMQGSQLDFLRQRFGDRGVHFISIQIHDVGFISKIRDGVRGFEIVVMTEKDAVKCRAFANDRHWAVRLDVTFDPADAARIAATLMKVTHVSLSKLDNAVNT